MPFSRREFLKLAALPAALSLVSRPMLRAMFAPLGGGPKNLVLIDLRGGCDGLNMVVPFGVTGGTYYSEFRKSLAIAQTLWQSGDVSGFATQGWLARHLAALGGPGPTAVAVEDTLTLLLTGSGGFVPAF